MPTQDHPIYKHVRSDAADQAARDDWEGARSSQHPRVNVFDKTSVPVQSIKRGPGLMRRLLTALMPPYTATSRQSPTTASAGPTTTGAGISVRRREKLIQTLQDRVVRREPRGRVVARAGQIPRGVFADILLSGPGEPKLPDEVFGKMHWGGVFAYVGHNEKSVRNLAESFDNKRGFFLEQRPTAIHTHTAGLRLPGITPSGHYFLARKIQLIQPGDMTERFTYHVELTPCRVTRDAPHGFVVTKRVPTFENLFWRLRQKFPQVDTEDLRKRAHKLIDHVFPTFLTREAAMLGILQKNLAPEYRSRVPKPLGIEKDSRGFVRTLHMNWMRIGGRQLSQIEFASQSAELLAAIHDQARVMHLDLRMDNMVITEEGVGFVDFGSAVRIGEQLEQSPMLDTLFSEMMRTSQIQRMLGKMIERGHVTNQAMAEVHGKVDKTVDSFYLAVQINKPTSNPELCQLIKYQPETDVAKALSALTAAVLRPKNPEMAQYKTANDILRGIDRIHRRVLANAQRKRPAA